MTKECKYCNGHDCEMCDVEQLTYAQGYQQALADVRAGVPEEKSTKTGDVELNWVNESWNEHRTAVLEHLDLLGSKE